MILMMKFVSAHFSFSIQVSFLIVFRDVYCVV